MRRVELGAVAALAAALLAGCVQPAEPTPSASPTPTYLCTPEAGGDEAPCSEADYQKMKEKDALYAEAEQVYRKYLDEFLAVGKKGGAKTMPSAMRQLIANDDLANSIQRELQIIQESNLRVAGSSIKIAESKRLPGRSRNGSVVGIDFCTDASANRLIRDGKTVGRGKVTRDMTFFGLSGEQLKMVSMQSKLVSKCTG